MENEECGRYALQNIDSREGERAFWRRAIQRFAKREKRYMEKVPSDPDKKKTPEVPHKLRRELPVSIPLPVEGKRK